MSEGRKYDDEDINCMLEGIIGFFDNHPFAIWKGEEVAEHLRKCKMQFGFGKAISY